MVFERIEYCYQDKMGQMLGRKNSSFYCFSFDDKGRREDRIKDEREK